MHDSMELPFLIFGALATWTGSVIGLVLWLTGRFRSLEAALYRETNSLRWESDRKFNANQTKIQRLEIKVFGFTPAAIAQPTTEEG